MKTVLLIAIDTIRELLHHRLLLAMMLVSLGLFLFFSFTLSANKKRIAQQDYENLSKAEQQEMHVLGSMGQATYYQFFSHHRLLLAMMLVSLGLFLFFSFTLSANKKRIAQQDYENLSKAEQQEMHVLGSMGQATYCFRCL